MGKVDAAYRRLFQHKELLRDLLACVLDPTLFNALDWDRMQPVPTHHVSDDLEQRSGDCAWLIPGKKASRESLASISGPGPGNQPPIQAIKQAPLQGLCILLILEQQAQPDDLMALRAVTYTSLT